MKVVSTKVTNNLHGQFRDRAESEGLSASMKLRQLVEDYLNNGVLIARQQEVTEMTTCGACKAYELALQREQKESAEERQYFERQGTQFQQQVAELQRQLQQAQQALERAHQGHHSIDDLVRCPNCKPSKKAMLQAVTRDEYYPRILDPVKVKI